MEDMAESRKIIAQNRKAHFNYTIEDKIECGIALYVNAYCYLLQCNSLRADSIAQYGIYTKGWSGHYHDINIDGCYKAGMLIEGESNVVDYFTSRCGFEYAGITDASQIAKEDWGCYSKVAINGNKNTVTLLASIPNLTDTDSPIYGNASQVSIQSGSTLNKILFLQTEAPPFN